MIPLKLYRQIHAAMPIPCVDIAMLKDGKLFMSRRVEEPDAGKWWMPGGRIHKWERPAEAAIRIAAQETGLRIGGVTFMTYAHMVFDADPFGHHRGSHTIDLIFIATDVEGEVKLDSTQSVWRWWDGKSKLDVAENIKPYCMKVLEYAS